MTDLASLTRQIETLSQQVDELTSRSAIRDLVSNYCLGFDSHDWDRFISIWHEDAVWDIGPPFGLFSGHQEIYQAVHDVLYPFWRESHHLSTNLLITFEGPDIAQGVCNVDCMGARVEDEVQMVGATYSDRFERRNGVWKIARRDVELHYFNPIPNVEMSAPA
mgnify:FL=1